MTSLGP